MTLPVIIIGAGGHAKVLIDSLILSGVQVLGVVDQDKAKTLPKGLNIDNLGTDEIVLTYPCGRIQLVNGLGSTDSTARRRMIFETFKAKGYRFLSVIHPASVISQFSQLGEGVQVMGGAIVNIGTSIGENTIINTKASVDHDCTIGAHVHIAPGATLSGGVEIGDGTHIGAGATVIQGIRIGRMSVVAAGAVVVSDIPDGVTVLGVPGKMVKR